MPNLNEIKSHIHSVKSTKQITRAMYLISVSKSQRAKQQMAATRPYFGRVSETLAEILSGSGNIQSPFIGSEKTGEGVKSLYLVLAGDKGMAGGYNHNIIALLDKKADRESADICVAGMMGRQQIARKGFRVNKEFIYPVMNPTVYRAREISELCADWFLTGKYDNIYIVYTQMVTPIQYEPKIYRLLPLAPNELLSGYEPGKGVHAFEYEPNPTAVFDHLTPHYLKGVIYGAFVEAFTSEQHARTYAMDNATKSADDMIERLSLIHNRARQAKITQEINEIVGGIPAE